MHTKAYPLAFHDPKVPICSFPDRVYRTLDARAFFHFWQIVRQRNLISNIDSEGQLFLARAGALRPTRDFEIRKLV